VCGASHRLVDLVVDPWDFLASNGRLRINTHYYIDKALLPPLERLLRDCLGVDVRRWYMEQPRVQRVAYSLASFAASLAAAAPGGAAERAAGIRRHLLDKHCFLCDRFGDTAICPACLAQPQASAFALLTRRRAAEERVARLHGLCAHCTGWAEGAAACEAVDCSLLYTRMLLEQDTRRAESVAWGLDLF
jgi:DNA polymerase zeta